MEGERGEVLWGGRREKNRGRKKKEKRNLRSFIYPLVQLLCGGFIGIRILFVHFQKSNKGSENAGKTKGITILEWRNRGSELGREEGRLMKTK